jgi:hypothetical protein
VIWRRHCSRSGRCSPPVRLLFLVLRRLLLGQDRVGIRLRARSQGGVVWRAAGYGWVLRVVGARRRIELVVTWRHAEARLTGERGRRSLKILASLVVHAPIACRSLSRASAHVYPVLFSSSPHRTATWDYCANSFGISRHARTRYVHQLDPSSLFIPQQQRSRSRGAKSRTPEIG